MNELLQLGGSDCQLEEYSSDVRWDIWEGILAPVSSMKICYWLLYGFYLHLENWSLLTNLQNPISDNP